jgi:hypothetical protein
VEVPRTRDSIRQPSFAQGVKQAIEVLLVLVLQGAVPIGFPVFEPASRKGRHLGLRDPEELLERRSCFLQPTGLGVARRKPPAHLVDVIAGLPQRGDRLSLSETLYGWRAEANRVMLIPNVQGVQIAGPGW